MCGSLPFFGHGQRPHSGDPGRIALLEGPVRERLSLGCKLQFFEAG